MLKLKAILASLNSYISRKLAVEEIATSVLQAKHTLSESHSKTKLFSCKQVNQTHRALFVVRRKV